jgi:hypothetical protein
VLRRVANGARRPPCCGSWSVAGSCASQLEVRGLAIGQDSVFGHPLSASPNSAPSFSIFLFCLGRMFQRLQLSCREYTFVRLGLYSLASFLNFVRATSRYF